MQHYGLHTRLLDWTESILVASYFAADEYPEEDGVLWGLCPFLLNDNEIDTKAVLDPSVPDVENIIRCAFGREYSETEKIVAWVAEEVDIRMLVQLSGLTIHSKKSGLHKLNGWENFLVRFDMPAEAKAKLKTALLLFGITPSSLFPDLKNLANDITATYSKRKS